ETITVRRLDSLTALSEGTPVLLVGKVVAQDWLTPDQPLVLRDALGDTTIKVLLSAPTFPLLQGDRVAVRGVLRTREEGTRAIENAVVQWLGAL
ncbi:MAG: hypothetical protein ACK4UU_03350, partial [Fimbriimonadales bacterium]